MKRLLILLLTALTALGVFAATASAEETSDLAPAAAYIDTAKTADADYPSIVSITPGVQGFTIKWTAYPGAVKYRLFMHNGTKWKIIGDTTSTSYLHTGLTDGVEYTYTVRVLNASGGFMSSYYTSGWKAVFHAAPTLLSASVAGSSVKVTWKKISDESCVYRVYRRSGSTWSGIATTSGDNYIDENVESGNTYTYTVRAYSSDMREILSGYNSAGISALYVETPHINKTESRTDGVRVIWSAVPGASSYRVFYYNGSKWKIIGDTAGTYYDHKLSSTGVEYTYTVRAMDSAGKFVSDYDREGWKHKHLATPKLTSLDNVYGGQKLTWQKVDGAPGYRIYYKTGSSWIFLDNCDTESYTATGLDSNTAYTYTVRCISDDGVSLYSYFDRYGLTKNYIEAPVVSSIENLDSGALLNWQEIEGAEDYRVFYHNGTKWKTIADVNTNSYFHQEAADGVEMTYTVRAIDSNGKFISGYNTEGFKHTYYAPPEFTKVEASKGSTYLEWDAHNGAAAYRVYRRGVTGKWRWLGDYSDTSYTDTKAPVNSPYHYTLRILDNEGDTVSTYLDNNLYYYNGELANGVFTVDNETYRFVDGKRAKDYVSAEDIIATAENEVGYAAEYLKKCKYNTWFYGEEVSGYNYDWCAVFVNWVFHEAGASELIPGKYANCGAMGLAFQQMGQLVTEDYQVGDVVFFHWDDSPSTFVPGMKSLDHVGIIKAVNDDGTFVTIEGNTGITRDGEVLIQTRRLDQITCAGRPDYGKKLTGDTLAATAAAPDSYDIMLAIPDGEPGGERPRR